MEEHQALYRKWRPATFSDVCGQEHVTSVLRYEAAHGRISHAYLFCGSRGTGKTTCAKILSKAVNCESPIDGDPCGKCPACRSIDASEAVDVIEMDAASNNGVDYIRDIRDSIVYTPAELKNRVYIIDEVHMLSQGAFNALLKTLEEPPAHVIFILATTELQKIPATILSRCQRFEFRRITPAIISARLKQIAEAEGIRIRDEAVTMLARLAQGGMRDAISLLELCAGAGEEITAETVLQSVGIAGRELLDRTVTAVLDRDFEAIFDITEQLYTSSRDIGIFWQDLIGYYRDMLVARTVRNPERYLELGEGELEALRKTASRFNRAKLVYHSRVLDEAYLVMQRGNAPRRLLAETTLLRLCDDTLSTEPDALAARITAIEDRLAGGVLPIAAEEKKPPETSRSDARDTGAKSGTEAPAGAAADACGVSAGGSLEAVPSEAPASRNTASPFAAGRCAPQPGTETQAARPLPDAAEIVKRVEKGDPGLASVLKISRILTDGVRIIIRADNAFAAGMLKQESNRAALAAAFTAQGTLGTVTPAELLIEEEKKTGSSAPELDLNL